MHQRSQTKRQDRTGKEWTDSTITHHGRWRTSEQRGPGWPHDCSSAPVRQNRQKEWTGEKYGGSNKSVQWQELERERTKSLTSHLEKRLVRNPSTALSKYMSPTRKERKYWKTRTSFISGSHDSRAHHWNQTPTSLNWLEGRERT